MRSSSLVPLIALAVVACTHSASADAHDQRQDSAASSSSLGNAARDTTIPPGAADARQRLATSPRHGEWVIIATGPQPSDSVRAWLVYPERSTKAPVVVVIHEIFGMSTWIRAVTDQLAADGFIAIAPDLLTGKYSMRSPADTISADSAVALVRTLDPDEIQRRITAVASYAMRLPAATPHYGIVGFCWGGGVSFAHATVAPNLGASVVYYGTTPSATALANVRAPVLGLYGGNDARVDATIPLADSTLHALGRTYEHFVFPGAGHGFLRAQEGQNSANLGAARAAWPKTVEWFRKYLGA